MSQQAMQATSATTPAAPPREVPAVPPRGILNAVISFRNFLGRVMKSTVPAPVAMSELIGSFFIPPILRAACKLGIADALASGPKTLSELAQATGGKEDGLYRLMRALISVGVFARRSDGRYALNRLGETLRTGVAGSMKDLAIFTGDRWHVDAWERLADTIRSGTNGVKLVLDKELFEYLDGTEEGRSFDGGMGSFTQMDAPAHAVTYDWGSYKKVCDVGGGQGTLLGHILAKHKHLEGAIFDLPKVVEGARPVLEAWHVADRVKLVGGSFFESVPSGYDVYMMRGILHDWDDARSVTILQTVKKAMSPTSKLLVIEMVIEDNDDPYPGKMLDIEMMAITSEGRERSAQQYAALFEKAGLKFSRVIPTSSMYSIVEGLPG
jgi:hypothetical protein